MGMYLSTDDVAQAARILDGTASILKGTTASREVRGLGTYSQVSGLDQAGRMHQAISSVSEPEATRGLAQFCYVHRVFGHGVRCLFGHGIHGVLGHF